MNIRLLTICAVLGSVFCHAAYAGDDALVLRLQDTIAIPGGGAAVAIRTYASRPVGQGQVCLVMRGAAGGTDFPISALKSFEIYATQNDVQQEVVVTRARQDITVMVTFESASASINEIDGPLGALFFEIAANAEIDTDWVIELDFANTAMWDAAGLPIPLDVRNGVLTIHDAQAPKELSAEVDQDVAGGPFSLSMQTNQSFGIGGGQIALRYNNRVLTGTPEIVYDPRFGFVEFKPDGYSGLAILRIADVGSMYNQLPGNIATIELTRHPAMSDLVGLGVRLDPTLTYLRDEAGHIIPTVIDDVTINRPYWSSPAKGDHKTDK